MRARYNLACGGSKILQLEEAKLTSPRFGLPPSRFFPRRYKASNIDSWTGHLAFANDLIAAIQPKLIVELGTHFGEAYFTFCQAVEEQRLPCVCYAVDHWLGDDHAGHYGEDVYQDVASYNECHYRHFSYLLRRNFDDARPQFADDSIDLLHIDGLHTYEAVSHDFRSWLPKVSKGGIVLLHDTCPRHQDFGVWRFWEEVKAEFTDTFEFHHSWGLGVVRKPGGTKDSPLTDFLFASSEEVREDVRRHYVIYASHLEDVLGPEVAERNAVAARLESLASEVKVMTAARDAAQGELERKDEMLELAEHRLYQIQHSLSWKVTEPVRRFMTALRSGRPRRATGSNGR